MGIIGKWPCSFPPWPLWVKKLRPLWNCLLSLHHLKFVCSSSHRSSLKETFPQRAIAMLFSAMCFMNHVMSTLGPGVCVFASLTLNTRIISTLEIRCQFYTKLRTFTLQGVQWQGFQMLFSWANILSPWFIVSSFLPSPLLYWNGSLQTWKTRLLFSGLNTLRVSHCMYNKVIAYISDIIFLLL